MDCVAVLAEETLMKPGAVVDYPAGQTLDSVSLPIANLFGPACQVPGVDLAALRKMMAEPQPVSIPQMTYDVTRSLANGADVEIPICRAAIRSLSGRSRRSPRVALIVEYMSARPN